mmetsp:Transcript_16363/g.52024  ORF Transcript_16363/g.52024 Transcript_16363/m.52024 type:complete len:109 (+) Transcript_16363:732-1058(+)
MAATGGCAASGCGGAVAGDACPFSPAGSGSNMLGGLSAPGCCGEQEGPSSEEGTDAVVATAVAAATATATAAAVDGGAAAVLAPTAALAGGVAGCGVDGWEGEDGVVG